MSSDQGTLTALATSGWAGFPRKDLGGLGALALKDRH